MRGVASSRSALEVRAPVRRHSRGRSNPAERLLQLLSRRVGCPPIAANILQSPDIRSRKGAEHLWILREARPGQVPRTSDD